MIATMMNLKEGYEDFLDKASTREIVVFGTGRVTLSIWHCFKNVPQ